MSEFVVCLGCGGLVDAPPEYEPQVPRCRCAISNSDAGAVLCPNCGGSLRMGVRSCPYCGSTVATCRCAGCYAWNLAGAEHCQACGRVLTKQLEAARPAAGFLCPRCKNELIARDYAELSANECDECGGLLLTRSMLDRLVAARDRSMGVGWAPPRRASVPSTEVSYIRCPVCSNVMNREAFGHISGVIVDVCREHGVWFDAGELTQVLEFVADGGLERARARSAEARADELRKLRAERARTLDTLRWQGEAEGAQGSVGSSYAELARELAQALSEWWRS